MQCQYCRYFNNHHSRNCPRLDPRAIELFNQGMIAGQNGTAPTERISAYMFGYAAGIIAASDAANRVSMCVE